MKAKHLFAAALLAPAIALANGNHHKPPPAPTPPPVKPATPAPAPQGGGGGSNSGGALVLSVAAIGIAWAIYSSVKKDKDGAVTEEKRVEVKPLRDGKGGMVGFVWEH